MAPSRTEILPAEEPATLSAHNLKVLNGASQDPYGHYFPADPATLNLESNYGPMESDMIGYLQPTTKDTPIEVMHERFERDGYLFVSISININAGSIMNMLLIFLCVGQGMHQQGSLS